MELSNEKTVSIDGNGLKFDTSEDVEAICMELAGKEVEKLVLQGNTFGIEAAERLGFELSRQPQLKEAHFRDIFTSRGREEVPVALKHLLDGICNSGAQLTLLDLSDNAIGPISAPPIVEFLASSSAANIEKLYLNNCGLGPEGSSSIAASISKLKKLREFICGRNRLENLGATNMSLALSELNTLEVLKLPQNGIFVEGIKKLVGALNANIETIKQIDLSDNTIKAEGADALEGPISKAKNLSVLRLDDALLENEGFSIICDALSKSQALTTMKEATFEGNEIHGQKIVDLIELTFAGCTLNFTLNLLANEFTKHELLQLEALAARFRILVDDPSDCEYSGEEDEEDTDQDTGSDEEEDSDDDDSSDENGKDNKDISKETNNHSTGNAQPFINSFDKLEI